MAGVYHASLAISYTLMASAAVRSVGAAADAAVASVRGSVNASDIEPLLPSAERPFADGLLQSINAGVNWLMTSVPPAHAKPLRIKHAVNFHKALCPVAAGAAMIYWQNRGLHCYIYLSMHGMLVLLVIST